jgi:restriction endonuclease S subunit
MDAHTLLGNFEILAEAPGGINRLRELILQLATNGKLLNSSARKTNPATGLPETWMLEPFNEVAQFAMGKTPPTKNPDFWGGVNSTMWVSIGDMQDGQTIKKSNKTVSLKAGSEVFRREPWPEGTLLMSFKLTIGKMARLGRPSFFNEAIFAFDAGNEITNEYLFRVLPLISRSANSKGAIKGNTLNSESISQMRVPVPPLLEQERIVAKVDELMALCDQLEQQQQHRNNLRTATRKSAIDAISTATTPEELETAWKLINNNWTTIADTPESIASLRSLILDLAVHGRFSNSLRYSTNSEVELIELGSVMTLEYGKPLDKSLRNTKGHIPVYGANGVKAMTGQSLVKERGIVVGRKGSAGEVNITDGPFWPLDVTFFAKFDEDAFDLQYLYYLLKSLDLPKMARGIKPGINRNDVNKLKVLSVDLGEQKRIVTKVDELMALCDGLEHSLLERNELSEKIAGAMAAEVAA